jgi:protein arginine kinase activator
MKCEHPDCDREATVHEVVVHKGKKVEKHLCEEHAKDTGLVPKPYTPINALLSKFVVSSTPEAEQKQEARRCAHCSLTFDEFRQHGLLGCAACYEAFEGELGPLIERAQEGAASHIGKAPRRTGGAPDRAQVIRALREQLSEALKAEHYERAADLRDQLREVGGSAAPQQKQRNAGEAEA